jgi:hypothetical protein
MASDTCSRIVVNWNYLKIVMGYLEICFCKEEVIQHIIIILHIGRAGHYDLKENPVNERLSKMSICDICVS